ncbi:MAG: O-methyltransferase involved in polyketide biosynthesis [Verrucomicrobiales bacterium]|jgi:O-methyltransferase involved in polyketide biosynthesis
MISAEELSPVAETMLWPLHGRAAEARRADSKLDDPLAIKIADAIDYDYAGSFGEPDFGHAMRALAIDGVLRDWISAHPNGQVVALGEGLETQFWRVDNGTIRWLTVDLPDAISLRKQLLGGSERQSEFAGSIADSNWMDQLDESREIFITAAGVLMYLDPDQVKNLIASIADRFPNSEIVFDGIPHWLSLMTTGEGWKKTPAFTMPPMPWGLDRGEISQIADWHPNIAEICEVPFRNGRGLASGGIRPLLRGLPGSTRQTPVLVHLKCQPN